MMLWDLPLSDQPARVKSALERANRDIHGANSHIPASLTGGKAYWHIMRDNGKTVDPAEITRRSRVLTRSGLLGHSYDDGQCTGGGPRYAVFDPDGSPRGIFRDLRQAHAVNAARPGGQVLDHGTSAENLVLYARSAFDVVDSFPVIGSMPSPKTEPEFTPSSLDPHKSGAYNKTIAIPFGMLRPSIDGRE